MASIYKRQHKRPDGTKSRSRCWYYAFTGEDGNRVTRRGFTDKEATKAKATREEKAAERKAAGLVSDIEVETGALAPLVDEWLADLERQGRSQSHLKYCRRYMDRVMKMAGWKMLGQIAPGPLTSLLAGLNWASDRTANAYRETVNTFCNYAVIRGWLAMNPVASVRKTRRGLRPKKKRAFTREELKALCDAAPENRRQIYLVAALSGLRWGELRELRWKNVDLDIYGMSKGTCGFGKPRWRLTAEHTKSKRADVLPMLLECATVLDKMAIQPDGYDPERRVFPSGQFWHHYWRRDREAAGLKASGPSGDLSFHSLRYFFCTELAKVLPIQRVRQLMRHRQIQTTMDLYCQLGLDDLFDEYPSLPLILKG